MRKGLDDPFVVYCRVRKAVSRGFRPNTPMSAMRQGLFSTRRSRLLAAIAAFVAALNTAGAAPAVNATIEPRQIAVGESARLTIVTFDNALSPVPPPAVSGLEFQLIGQSRQIQSIHGASLSTISVVYRVTALAAGTFTIPGITPASQPLVLRVTAAAGGNTALRSGSASADRKLPGAGGSSDREIRLTPDGSAFVRLGLPKHEIYVGESIPVEIQVGMRDGFVASLNGAPTLKNDDFTLTNISHRPDREDKVIDGKPFTVLTWHNVLAAIKPGEYSLSMETPLTVRIRTRPRQDTMLDDLLGDPFLQNYFGPTIRKDITVASPPAAFTVLALPTQGRPADFSGAVGNFKISSDVSTATVAAGDPFTLRMHVTGVGNFDRVSSSVLDGVQRWKTYQPKATFTPSDATGHRGEKVFEQPLIATQPGPQILPGLTFSFFDPDTRSYQTVRSSPLNVTVTAPAGAAAAGGMAPAAGAAGTLAGEARNGLRPDHASNQAVVASLLPLYFQPRFLAIPSVLVLLFTGGWVGLRRRAGGGAEFGNARGRVSSRTAAVLKQLEAASRSGDTALYFNTARSALQRSLAARWQVAPEHIAAADLGARLGDDGEDVRRIFLLADEASYAGRELQSADFERWTQIVRRLLSATNPP